MATTNATKRFQQLLPKTIRYRGKVVQVDSILNRAKIEHGASISWANTNIDLLVNDNVLVIDGMVNRKMPNLPFLRLEVS